MLPPPEPFAWEAVLGHSVAGFLQRRSATSSLSGKNLSICDKRHLVGAERWDPPGETHKATFVSTSRVSPQECQTIGAERSVWKRLWEALRDREVFAWDRASQKWGLEFLAGAGISPAMKTRGRMRAGPEDESFRRHRKGSGTIRVQYTHPNSVISIVSL